MTIYKGLIILLLVLIGMACLSLAEGQNNTASSSVASNSALQYTVPTVSASSTHISAPVQINILGKTLTRYLGPQVMPYSQYQSSASNTGNSLWIQETPSWMQYAEVPQGAAVTLVAASPTGGSGYLSEIFNGTKYNSNFYFYRNSQLIFYADAVGQHTLSFSINGQPSNQVTINVIAFVPPQNYLAPYNFLTPNYYYYSGYHYPGYKFRSHWPRFYGGHIWYDSEYPWLNAP